MNERPLLIASAFGPFAFVSAVLAGGAMREGYSHLRDPVSSLTEAGASGAAPVAALFIVSAALSGLFALALLRRYRRRDGAMTTAGVLLAANAVMAVALATIFPPDPIGAPMTPTGVAHIVLVAISALAIVASIVIAARQLPRLETCFGGFFAYSMATVALMALGGLATPLVVAFDWPLLGLAERITQMAYLQWFVATPLKLARVVRQRPSVDRRLPL